MNTEESILRFYLLTNTLKRKIRQGTLYWNVDTKRKDSIAEHVYGTCMLAIAIKSEYNIKMNLERVLHMLLVHELEEIYIGDITPFDGYTAKQLKEMGKKAVEKVLAPLKDKKYYIDLLDEFNARETKDACFAYMCDKLEFDLQMMLYSDEGKVDFDNMKDSPVMNSSEVQKIIADGATPKDVFYKYDVKKFENNTFFSNVQFEAWNKNLKDILEKYINEDKV